MGKKLAIPVMIIIVAIAIAIAVSFFPGGNGIFVEGILIDSGIEDEFETFASFSKNDTFLISPQMNERAKSVDHVMFNSTALFLQVLGEIGRAHV